MKKLLVASAAVLVVSVISSCSESEGGATDDPAAAYATLVKAATRSDYGYLYDALDGDMRRGFDSLIAISYRSRATLSEADRKFWDSAGTRDSRSAFIAVMGRDPLFYTSSLQGQYKFIKADTLVILTIEKGGKEELRYFSPEAGGLRVTSPPIVSSPELPPGHPGTGSDGATAIPPNDSVHGGSGAGSATVPGAGPSKQGRR